MSPALTLVAMAVAAALSIRSARDDLLLPAWLTIGAFTLPVAAIWCSVGSPYAPIVALTVACLLIAESDRRHHLVPDLLVLSVLVLALVMPFGDDTPTRLLGASALGATFALIRQACSSWRGVEALGWGDVKLAVAMGAVLGPIFGFVAVAVAGAATLIVVIARTNGAATAAGAPFGIGLAAATAAVAIVRAVCP